jgi:hypothetical protein
VAVHSGRRISPPARPAAHRNRSGKPRTVTEFASTVQGGVPRISTKCEPSNEPLRPAQGRDRAATGDSTPQTSSEPSNGARTTREDRRVCARTPQGPRKVRSTTAIQPGREAPPTPPCRIEPARADQAPEHRSREADQRTKRERVLHLREGTHLAPPVRDPAPGTPPHPDHRTRSAARGRHTRQRAAPTSRPPTSRPRHRINARAIERVLDDGRGSPRSPQDIARRAIRPGTDASRREAAPTGLAPHRTAAACGLRRPDPGSGDREHCTRPRRQGGLPWTSPPTSSRFTR